MTVFFTGPYKSPAVRFVFIDSTTPARRAALTCVVLLTKDSCDCCPIRLTTRDSRCFEFVCLVKSPFDLQILMHFGQGNDFLPPISVRTSRNSASPLSVFVSKTVSETSRLKASYSLSFESKIDSTTESYSPILTNSISCRLSLGNSTFSSISASLQLSMSCVFLASSTRLYQISLVCFLLSARSMIPLIGHVSE